MQSSNWNAVADDSTNGWDALTNPIKPSAASLRAVLIAVLMLATPPAFPQTTAEYETTRRSLLYFAEVALARMGYLQGPFSGEATSALRAAVSTYESDRRLPITGDPLSARTFDQLGADIKNLSHEPVGVPSSTFVDSYWDDGHASSTGTWMIENDEVAFPEQATRVTCERDRKECIEFTAVLVDTSFGGHTLSIDTTRYEIERWDRVEIVSRPRHAVCARNVLRLNRVQKSVTAVRSTISTDGPCKGMALGDSSSRLVNGSELFDNALHERRAQEEQLLRQTPELRQFHKGAR